MTTKWLAGNNTDCISGLIYLLENIINIKPNRLKSKPNAKSPVLNWHHVATMSQSKRQFKRQIIIWKQICLIFFTYLIPCYNSKCINISRLFFLLPNIPHFQWKKQDPKLYYSLNMQAYFKSHKHSHSPDACLRNGILHGCMPIIYSMERTTGQRKRGCYSGIKTQIYSVKLALHLCATGCLWIL